MANYTKPPTVLVSPKHSTSGGNIDPLHNAISAWIEVSYYLPTAFSVIGTNFLMVMDDNLF